MNQPDKLSIEHIENWLALPETDKMAEVMRHGIKPSKENLMIFADLAKQCVDTMRENERLQIIINHIPPQPENSMRFINNSDGLINLDYYAGIRIPAGARMDFDVPNKDAENVG